MPADHPKPGKIGEEQHHARCLPQGKTEGNGVGSQISEEELLYVAGVQGDADSVWGGTEENVLSSKRVLIYSEL